jgi:sulfur-carrier protein adenylyltransferase/sulfurtransferase
LVSLDAARWRMGGFRFDRAPEPVSPLPFIARSQIRADDLLIDLRVEAAPFAATARHIPPEPSPPCPTPRRPRGAGLRHGLRAHNAGQTLHDHWPGDIALLALTD